jgi:hypothetical protein
LLIKVQAKGLSPLETLLFAASKHQPHRFPGI